MNHIDYIYYTSTSTNSLGEVTVIESTYFIPFFDFLLVLFVLSFTILSVWFTDHLIHNKNYKKKSFRKSFRF